MIFRPLLIILVCCFVSSVYLFPQATVRPENDRARLLFEEKNYADALVLYEQLLLISPKNPYYHYYAGVCLLETGGDIERAIFLLNYATNGYVPQDVYYYLGKANFYHYNFEEAITSFSRVPPDIAIAYNVPGFIAASRYAISKTANGIPYKILYQSFVNADFLLDSVKKICKEYQQPSFPAISVIRINKSRDKADFSIFSGETGDIVFFSSDNQGNRDLYRMQRIIRNKQSKPQNMGELINTDGNELFPYYNASQSVLYFSSNKHPGMGGYDIFKTVFDKQSNTWSVPENLGFPINSTADDFMFIPLGADRYLLVSNRGGDTDYSLFILQADKQAKPVRYRSAEEKYFASVFSNVTVIDEMKNQSGNPAQKITDAELIKYRKNIQQGLILQAQSDSILWLAEKSNRELFLADNSASIISTRKEIFQWRKLATELQNNAMVYFNTARDMELNYGKVLEKQSKNQPEIQNSVAYRFSIIESRDNKICTDSLPSGICYRIQLGAFGNIMPVINFKGMSPLFCERVEKQNVFKYYAGIFPFYFKAVEALETVRQLGFKDAFIIAYFNGKEISTEKAKLFENKP